MALEDGGFRAKDTTPPSSDISLIRTFTCKLEDLLQGPNYSNAGYSDWFFSRCPRGAEHLDTNGTGRSCGCNIVRAPECATLPRHRPQATGTHPGKSAPLEGFIQVYAATWNRVDAFVTIMPAYQAVVSPANHYPVDTISERWLAAWRACVDT